MTRFMLAPLCVLLLATAPIKAEQVLLYDDFEDGLSGWVTTSPGPPFHHNLAHWDNDVNKNITPGGDASAHASPHSEASWHSIFDFGAQPINPGTYLRASVWVYDGLDFFGGDLGSTPVRNMIALMGNTPSGNPGFGTEYFQLGAVTGYPGGGNTYATRIRNGDTHTDTGVSRSEGWTHLAIEVDAVADGGGVRFFIDNNQVGTGQRHPDGADLRWVRLGWNGPNYENFWYDDVRVSIVPEPTSVVLLGLVGLTMAGLVRRRRG